MSCKCGCQTLCPGSYASWSLTSLPGSLDFATYDLRYYGTDTPPGWLTVRKKDGYIDTFIGVPQTVAQQFEFTPDKNKEQFYRNQIDGRFHDVLLIEGSNCPLANPQGGYLWTK